MSVRPLTSLAFKPHPIGRFLVDLPEESVIGQWYQTYGASGRISVVPEVSVEEFEAAVMRRTEGLRSIPHEEGGTQLEKTLTFDFPHGHGVLYWENNYLKGDLLKADCYAWHGGFLYKCEAETWCEPEQQRSDLRWLSQILASIRPLQPDEIPTEYGFCFKDSILVDQPIAEGLETIIATAHWRDRPDVLFHFSTLPNNQTTDPPLLTRVHRPSLLAGIRVLRSGQRNLASGEPGEEHLERIKEGNGAVGHLFIWEAQGLPKFQYEHPQIRLEMTTGNGPQGPEHASLSDADALKVWDAVVGSIRLRPVTRPG
jgi:hypothetical protein